MVPQCPFAREYGLRESSLVRRLPPALRSLLELDEERDVRRVELEGILAKEQILTIVGCNNSKSRDSAKWAKEVTDDAKRFCSSTNRKALQCQ